MPGNAYAPEQCERLLVAVHINMVPYYVPVTTDEPHQFFAFAGRIDKNVLLDMFQGGTADIGTIVAALVPREIGISNSFTIDSGAPANPAAADFALTNSVSETITAYIDHYPADSDVIIASIADIDQLGGLGDLILTGTAYSDGGLGASSHALATVNPGGPIPAYDSLAVAVALGKDATPVDGAMTAQVDRTLSDRNDDAYMTEPFDFLAGLAQAGRTFSFSDPSTAWSPYPDLVRGNFHIKTDGVPDREVLWEFFAPGGETSVTLPALPTGVSAPLRAPVAGESLKFEVSVAAFTAGAWPYFDFNDFDFETAVERTTHMSYRDIDVANPY
jgi:hypothetical protein